MGSRIRENPDAIFEVFTEIARPTDPSQEPFVLQKFPEDFNDEELLNNIPKFAFPCDAETTAVDHFTFVQTDIESKFKFGFCRHGMGAQTCLCIVSCLPWYEIFYRLLNELAEILNRSDNNNVVPLLTAIYAQGVLQPGQEIDVVTPNLKERFTFSVPDPLQLPRIPDNRNLTEYYNAVDHANMMAIFAAMLFERRLLVTSRRLSRLTACIHGAASLLYPMHWQHLYIPVLPPILLDYCSAPMPFLIGLHSTLLQRVHQKQELGDAVILDADTNTLTSPYDDLGALPADIVSSMKKKLKSLQSEKMKGLMGDGVARVFLKTLVSLIGGYRDALKFRSGEQITFDPEAFIQSRPASMQPFLESMLHLQIFEQFINDRLDRLNTGLGFSDEFEVEANMLADKSGSQSKYKEWLIQAKRQGRKLRREGKDKWVEFTSKANPAVRQAMQSVKDKSKKAYKDLKSKMDVKKEEELGPGLSRSRPTTLPSPQLRTVRVGGQPRRPPPPVIQSPLSTDPNSQLLRRASYEKRSRQYKVLTIDDLNGADDGDDDAAVSAVRRASQDDDITYNRVSVDLLNDIDIQQVFKKSYSLEDLTRLTSPTIPDIEEAEDALLVGENLGGYHSLVTVPSHCPPDSTGSSDQSTSSTPTPAPRRIRVDTPPAAGSQPSSGGASPSIPRPAPRRRRIEAPGATTTATTTTTPGLSLLQLRAPTMGEGRWSRSSSPASLEAGEGGGGPAYKPLDEFDPLEGRTEDNHNLLENSHEGPASAHLPEGAEDSNNNNLGSDNLGDEEALLTPRSRTSIYRHNAFYNLQRPPAVKRRTSPTPMATDAQTLKEARTLFMQAEVARPMPGAVSLTGLDLFDPLLTGQLAVDAPPAQLSGASSSRSSGSSVDTGISSAGSRAQSAETVAAPTPEENLLKEWNLDFSKMRVSTTAATAAAAPGPSVPGVKPPVPPKPTLRPPGTGRGFCSPVHSGQPRQVLPGLTGQAATGVTMAGGTYARPTFFSQQQQQPSQTPPPPPQQQPHQQQHLHIQQTIQQQQQQQQQQISNLFRLSPSSSAAELRPTAGKTSPIHTFTMPPLAGPPVMEISAPPTGPPLLRPRNHQPLSPQTSGGAGAAGATAMTTSAADNPFGDLDPLLTPGTQVRPASMPAAPQPRNSWERFD